MFHDWFLCITDRYGIALVWVRCLPAMALLIVLLAAILVTSVYGWTLERVAYRPLRGSFRLAALITALGASIFYKILFRFLRVQRSNLYNLLFKEVLLF